MENMKDIYQAELVKLLDQEKMYKGFYDYWDKQLKEVKPKIDEIVEILENMEG